MGEKIGGGFIWGRTLVSLGFGCYLVAGFGLVCLRDGGSEELRDIQGSFLELKFTKYLHVASIEDG